MSDQHPEEEGDLRGDITVIADSKLSRQIRFAVRRELKKLPDVLAEGEVIETMAQGAYDRKNGLVVLTDRRVVFLEEGMMRHRLEDFPYAKISSVQSEKGMMYGKVTIFASGNSAKIENVHPKERAVEIGDFIRNRLDSVGAAPTPPPAATTPQLTPQERIVRITTMRDEGLLTEDEYQAKRAEILAEL